MPALSFIPEHRFRLARTFRANARFHTPACVASLLAGVTNASSLALLVDLDTLERTRHARAEAVLLLSLDALSYADIEVATTAAHHDTGTSVPRVTPLERESCIRELRQRASTIIALTDDPALLAQLSPADRGIVVRTRCNGIRALSASNIAMVSDVAVRSILWWLVAVRSTGSRRESA